MGLSWEFSVRCKDSSGRVGFDYDGLHAFTLFCLGCLVFGEFWGAVWKCWREAVGLSWQCLIGCKDSSGLAGFD